MDQNCNVVRDILPLYVDEVCSKESKELVERHVQQCQECANILAQLKNNECVEMMKQESNEVVARHAKKERRVSAVIGLVFAAILMIPILACMIVNLVTGHGLSWFFIVLTSLMVFASLTVVPLVAYTNKGLWTIGTFTASLLILFATICIYTRGRWFFIVSSSTLFGLGIIFFPIIAREIKKGFFSHHKGFFVLGLDTILFLVMIFVIGVNVHSTKYWSISGTIVFIVLLIIWGIFIMARYVKVDVLTKAGLITIWIGFWTASAKNIAIMMLGYTVVWHAFRPFEWNLSTINSNLHWIEFIVCTIIGGLLVTIGSILQYKKNRK